METHKEVISIKTKSTLICLATLALEGFMTWIIAFAMGIAFAEITFFQDFSLPSCSIISTLWADLPPRWLICMCNQARASAPKMKKLHYGQAPL
ncbi:hypothetical protein [Laceyella putida]|uniref:Uncharacterized protein n=1 Tax=Laceyella putida TaxID=110101 RepID=A0ABW2RLP1_9BACL